MSLSRPAGRTRQTLTHHGHAIRIVVVAVLGVVLVLSYLASVNTYRTGLDKQFEPPPTTPGGVAVVLVPVAVDANLQAASTEILIYPGADLLTAEGRLTRDISLDLYPSAGAGTITFPQDTIPSPQRVEVPAIGIVQRYPFDSYEYDLQVRTIVEPTGSQEAALDPLPMSLTHFFQVPGWDFRLTSDDTGFGERTHHLSGVIPRAGSTITIAVIFVLLILMFGVLSVVTVVSGVMSQLEFTISTAAWLTSAIFALVALRNGLPGSPPLGSWMDILVYFWVVAVIMLMIGITVVTLVTRARTLAHERETGDHGEPDEAVAALAAEAAADTTTSVPPPNPGSGAPSG